MIDEKLYSDLLNVYADNVKLFKEKVTGVVIRKVWPLTKEDIEKALGTTEYVDHKYINQRYRSFTVNPQITEMSVKPEATVVEISPDISWEREVNID